ncbi:PKD domain-containing protein [Halobaculum sp. MBLA0147]|uniref:PKD domain-containing protein n=1 Tax=Halobaculum sp. MBLA0147 TaxID=3079934 RepID=UPI0035244A9C
MSETRHLGGRRRLVVAVVVLAAVGAVGGGAAASGQTGLGHTPSVPGVGAGSGGATVVTATETDQPPVARAGLDQTVPEGRTAYLDAGGSFDPDGEIVAYHWSVTGPDGRVVGLDGGEDARATFTPRSTGTYTARVTVTDDDGATRTDTASVTVVPPPETHSPTRSPTETPNPTASPTPTPTPRPVDTAVPVPGPSPPEDPIGWGAAVRDADTLRRAGTVSGDDCRSDADCRRSVPESRRLPGAVV